MLILFAQNVHYLYASRLLNGFVAAGYFVIGPLFFTEIANDNIRGVLGSTVLLSLNIGFLLGFVLGDYCDYFVMPKVAIAFAALAGVLLLFFPESPTFLTRQNKIAEAEKSIRFYRGISDGMNNELVQDEINRLKKAVGNISDGAKKNPWKWSNVTTGIGRKALTIGLVLGLLSRCSGCMVLLTYTANIFQEAETNLSPNMATIVVGVIQLVGSYVATFLVDKAGRKILFIVSTVGTGLGLTTLGVYMMLKAWNYDVVAFNWVPVTSVSFTIFIASWAVLTLPFLVIAEIMPENIKDVCVSFCASLIWLTSFLLTKSFPYINGIVGFHGTMFIFAAVCLFCVIFIIFFMPETKGKSREEIMKLLQ